MLRKRLYSSSSIENVSSGESDKNSSDSDNPTCQLSLFTFISTSSDICSNDSSHYYGPFDTGSNPNGYVHTPTGRWESRSEEMRRNSPEIGPLDDLTFPSDSHNYGQLNQILGHNSAFTPLFLTSLEKEGSSPMIQWSSINSEIFNTHQFQRHPHPFNILHLNQGFYEEIKQVVPSDAWINKSREDRKEKNCTEIPTWIFIGFRSLDKTLDSRLARTWKEWSGCRHIYLNLRNDFDTRRIYFFERVHPQNNFDLFKYILLMEIGNVHQKNCSWLLEFVQRTRMEILKGSITLYQNLNES